MAAQRKRMVSVRLAPPVVDRLDELAAAAGQTRTEWVAGTLARAVLGSGRPQTAQAPVDAPRPAEPTLDLLVRDPYASP